MNTCHNAVDRHLATRGDQTAIVYESPVTETVEKITYKELHRRVVEFAAGLQAMGLTKRDKVIVYMAMVPEVLIACLACARLGAIHSVVFGGFGAPELASRIADAKPKFVIANSCGIEPTRVVPYKPLLDDALRLSPHQPEKVVLLQRPQMEGSLEPGRDVLWEEVVDKGAGRSVDCVPVASSDPLYMLYTSGTTGQPKGVLRDNAGHAVAMLWSMKNVFDVHAGETIMTASDIGWTVGHSFVLYGPLLTGATTILFEGKPVGTPDASTYWRIVADHQVRCMFTAPTALRAIRKADPEGALLTPHVDRMKGHFKHLFVAGERCDSATLQFFAEKLGVDVIDHYWMTETGWPMIATCVGLSEIDHKRRMAMGLPLKGKGSDSGFDIRFSKDFAADSRGMPRKALRIKLGSATKPVPGWNLSVVKEDGSPQEVGQSGDVVVRLPMPPGSFIGIHNDEGDERLRGTYLTKHPGFFHTGDVGYVDADGYFFVTGRSDDVLNVAGHRLSCGHLEEPIAGHPSVAEVAVIGIKDSLKGQLPVALVVLKEGVTKEAGASVPQEVVDRMRYAVGPVAALTVQNVILVDRLPKTRSGKVMRSTMRKMADGQPYKVPPTIEDPSVLEALKPILCHS